MAKGLLSACVVAALAGAASGAMAGPVIIDGTDANDHGSAGATNQAGWLYMQKALENIAVQYSGSTKVLVDLGTSTGQARNAINSAFSLSSLPAAGWTLTHVDGAANVAAWLAGLSTANTGILYIPTFGNSGGDMDSAEMAAVNAAANSINNFVAGAGNPALGGGLFAQGESGTGAWGWLSTLIPGLIATDIGGGGFSSDITLTAAGGTAFPGLTNTDLAGADPWHGHFSGNLGGLSVLGVANQSGVTRNIIIGGGAGTVIGCGQPGQPPCATPEPGTLPTVGLAIAGLWFALRRRVKGR